MVPPPVPSPTSLGPRARPQGVMPLPWARPAPHGGAHRTSSRAASAEWVNLTRNSGISPIAPRALLSPRPAGSALPRTGSQGADLNPGRALLWDDLPAKVVKGLQGGLKVLALVQTRPIPCVFSHRVFPPPPSRPAGSAPPPLLKEPTGSSSAWASSPFFFTLAGKGNRKRGRSEAPGTERRFLGRPPTAPLPR